MSSPPELTPVDTLRVAVVHEWVDAYTGSDQVFEALAKLFPSADLYALSMQPNIHLDLGGRTVTTTFLDTDRLRSRPGLTLPPKKPAGRFLTMDANVTLIPRNTHCDDT